MAGPMEQGDKAAATTAETTAAPADPKAADSPAAASKADSPAKPAEANLESELRELRDLIEAQSKQIQSQSEQLKEQQQQMQTLENQLNSSGAAGTANAADRCVTPSTLRWLRSAPQSRPAVMTPNVLRCSEAAAQAQTSCAPADEPPHCASRESRSRPAVTSRLKPCGGTARSVPASTRRSTPCRCPGNEQSHITEFNASGRQSRIAMLAQGKLKGVTIGGYYEGDFLSAGITSNDNQSNSYTFRQRQFWGQAKFDSGWTVTGGQMWSLVTETKNGVDNRTEATTQTIDAQYNVGFSWARQYGLRVSKRLSATSSGWRLSVEEAQTTLRFRTA